MKANRKRNNQIKIYLSDEELEILENLCIETDSNKSVYIRELILQYAR